MKLFFEIINAFRYFLEIRYYMPFVKRTAWVVEAEDDVQCSASADTVVIQSDDEDPANSHIVFAGTLEDMSRKASSKKATAMCEACDEGIVTVATCLSGNQKLCELCDLAEWAAGLCSSCGDMPVTREQPLCSARLCDVCDLSLWVVQNGFM